MTNASPSPLPSTRLASIDAYRGLVMFLMMAEVLRLRRGGPGNSRAAASGLSCPHQSHVEWVGCSLHDLIQPSFSFLVGVALPFSIASRRRRGNRSCEMTVHAFWRALVLVVLGIFLRSLGQPQTNFTFEDTLTQIGLGYGLLFLLGFRPVRDQWIALGVILVGYWAAFALYPLPGTGFRLRQRGRLGGLAAAPWPDRLRRALEQEQQPRLGVRHLVPESLSAARRRFVFNGGGYATLSFIPTLGTMILGLIAGGVLRSAREPPGAKCAGSRWPAWRRSASAGCWAGSAFARW